ncbi:MAG: DegT/DnrJ/EryC1/StrS family aminotransferase [Candidatus Kapaibacteriota bacterium]
MKVPLLDLKAQYSSIQEEVESELLRVARSQMCILGKDVEDLEKSLAKYLGVKHTIAVSSGSDALLMALMAYDVRPGDEIIMPTFSFFATAGSAARLFAKPVLVDSDPVTFNIDPKKIEEKITDKTKAIMPVHLFGQACEMDEILAIANKYNIPVIEDAAQALGTQYKDGRFVGSIGNIGCFSFYPSKNLGAFGDGGLVSTNDDNLAEKLKYMRNHGMNPRYYHKFIGGNFRLDAIQAVVLSVKLKQLESWHSARRYNAQLYESFFAELNLTKGENPNVITPKAVFMDSGVTNYHIYNQFTIRVKNRNELKEYLAQKEIGSDIYYPVPFHQQECFNYLNLKNDDFPVANELANSVLSLPIFPELTENQISYVAEVIAEFYGKK